MNAKRLVLGLLSATVVLSPLAAFKLASARTITTAYQKANLIAAAIFIDPTLLASEIREAIVSSKNRAGFVVRAMEIAAFHAKEGKYNVLVFNTSQPYETDIRGETVQYTQTFDYDGVPFIIWIFKKGKFVNKGDAGFNNWAMYGNFKKDGKTVTFDYNEPK